MSAPPDSIDCRLLQVLTVVEDEHRCRAVTDLLVDRAVSRWSGRRDCVHFPPLQRWRAVEPGYLDGTEILPADIICAVAAGHIPDTRDLAFAMRAMVVLHSGCPARVQPTVLPNMRSGALSASPRRGFLLSIYGLDEDDIRLAEGLIEACISVGVLAELERFARWLPVPLAGQHTDRLDRTRPSTVAA
jgi:hypothetical protein